MISIISTWKKYFKPSWSTEKILSHESAPMLDTYDKEANGSIKFYSPNSTSTWSWKRLLPWIPHIILIAVYIFVYTSLSVKGTFDHILNYSATVSTDHLTSLWEARFKGTFLEVGDFFNISESTNPSDGALAAWSRIQSVSRHSHSFEEANIIRVDRAYVLSNTEGDPEVLYKVHRLHCLENSKFHGGSTFSGSDGTNSSPLKNSPLLLKLTPNFLDCGLNFKPFLFDMLPDPNLLLDHCYEILQFALMCEGDITLVQVGWGDTVHYRAGMIDVQRYCRDPEADGLEKNLDS